MEKLNYKILNNQNTFKSKESTSPYEDFDNFDKLSKLNQIIYTNEIAKCDECVSFKKCKQQNKGLYPIIVKKRLNNDEYTLAYMKCSKYPGELIGSYQNAIYNALPLYDINSRETLLKRLRKGLGGFLYGSAGVGKSTIMLNIAKELNENGRDVYYELANNISVMLKDFTDNEKKMRLLQNVDVLFIDDFARETMTSWVILNIFNPILQYRIDNNKTTYITCNYSIAKLFDVIKTKTDYESADALISRITTLGIYKLDDKNYRLEERK